MRVRIRVRFRVRFRVRVRVRAMVRLGLGLGLGLDAALRTGGGREGIDDDGGKGRDVERVQLEVLCVEGDLYVDMARAG